MTKIVLVEDGASYDCTMVALCDLEDIQILQGLSIKIRVLHAHNVIN